MSASGALGGGPARRLRANNDGLRTVWWIGRGRRGIGEVLDGEQTVDGLYGATGALGATVEDQGGAQAVDLTFWTAV